ncbi:hypothetical protein CYMTET_11108 [Cymbomonas tetramitiformis]|uniref:Uncharacterized protein n=1 Tax=Cymbomonas tetramitiformis TaxID=36881 RepID=A0AAE0GN95_9CHLO|nr:hypothetical protein CYMTET_11108 [Cymbomonas tetramitiformis]
MVWEPGVQGSGIPEEAPQLELEEPPETPRGCTPSRETFSGARDLFPNSDDVSIVRSVSEKLVQENQTIGGLHLRSTPLSCTLPLIGGLHLRHIRHTSVGSIGASSADEEAWDNELAEFEGFRVEMSRYPMVDGVPSEETPWAKLTEAYQWINSAFSQKSPSAPEQMWMASPLFTAQEVAEENEPETRPDTLPPPLPEAQPAPLPEPLPEPSAELQQGPLPVPAPDLEPEVVEEVVVVEPENPAESLAPPPPSASPQPPSTPRITAGVDDAGESARAAASSADAPDSLKMGKAPAGVVAAVDLSNEYQPAYQWMSPLYEPTTTTSKGLGNIENMRTPTHWRSISSVAFERGHGDSDASDQVETFDHWFAGMDESNQPDETGSVIQHDELNDSLSQISNSPSQTGGCESGIYDNQTWTIFEPSYGRSPPSDTRINPAAESVPAVKVMVDYWEDKVTNPEPPENPEPPYVRKTTIEGALPEGLPSPIYYTGMEPYEMPYPENEAFALELSSGSDLELQRPASDDHHELLPNSRDLADPAVIDGNETKEMEE